jgi:hypothetical protein
VPRAAEACKGKMRTTLERGKKKVSKATLKLDGKCRFGGRRILPESKIGKARALNRAGLRRQSPVPAPAQRTYKLKIR